MFATNHICGARALEARGQVANQNSCQGGQLSQLMSSLPGTSQACQTKGRVSSEIHQQEVRLAFLLSSLQNIQIYFLPGNNGKKSDLVNISFEGWCLLLCPSQQFDTGRRTRRRTQACTPCIWEDRGMPSAVLEIRKCWLIDFVRNIFMLALNELPQSGH